MNAQSALLTLFNVTLVAPSDLGAIGEFQPVESRGGNSDLVDLWEAKNGFLGGHGDQVEVRSDQICGLLSQKIMNFQLKNPKVVVAS